jgi:hypothetical protein
MLPALRDATMGAVRANSKRPLNLHFAIPVLQFAMDQLSLQIAKQELQIESGSAVEHLPRE